MSADDRHPLVGELNAMVGQQLDQMSQAVVDASVLGTGWLRLRICPRHGLEIVRIDPSRVTLSLNENGACDS